MKSNCKINIKNFIKTIINTPWCIKILIIILFIVPILSIPECIWNYGDKLGIIIGLFTAGFAFSSWLKLRDLHKNETLSPETKAGDKDIALLFQITGKDDLTLLKDWLSNNENKKKLISNDVFSNVIIQRKNTVGDIVSSSSVDEEINRINDNYKENNSPFEIAKEKESSILILKSDGIEEWEKALGNLRNALNDISNIISASGIEKIHLFYDGPVALAFPISEYFANRKVLVLYQWTGKEYFDIGTLGRVITKEK